MNAISQKRRDKLEAEGVKLYGSTIARKPKKKTPFTPAGLNGVNRFAASSPKRSSPMPKARKPIAKRNTVRQAAQAREYAKKLRDYRKSPTWTVVEERCGGRCEFAVAVDPGRLPLVRDIPVDRPMPAGYVRCENEHRDHHHLRYGRQFGGNERPRDMLAGCGRCHGYVESAKLVSRSSRSRAGQKS